jgi:diguanylate cyclase (GGDEF)-like protein
MAPNKPAWLRQGDMMSARSEAIGGSDPSPRRADVLRRRRWTALHRIIWAGVTITSIGFVTVAGWVSFQSRSRTIDAGTASVQNLALVLDKLIAHKIAAVDTLLHIALHPSEDAGVDKGQDGPVPHRALLAELTNDRDYVRTVKLVKAEDGVTILNLADSGEAGDGIDLETHLAHARDPKLQLYISRPRRDGPSRKWLVGISRAGTRSTGTAAFLAIAHVDIEQLQRVFDEINVGPNGAITLWRGDGVLLARKPYQITNVGRSFPNAALHRALARSPVGHFETESAADGVYRIVAYRALRGTPLIIAASLAKDDVLAPWRQDTARGMALVGAAIALLIVFGAVVAREARRRADAEASANHKSAVLEATLENMDQGLIMFDADLRVQVCNHRAMDLLDLPASLMRSQPQFEDIKRYEFERGEFGPVDQDFDVWVQTQKLERVLHTFERERPNGTVLEVRTAPIADGGAVRTYTDITARKLGETRIAHMARHDALTGLPNRLLLRERLEEALARVAREGDTLAILCLDLDHFKTVNDTLGHPIGDALLKAVSERIKTQLRPRDTVARLGGDEFAILQVGGKQPQSANRLAQRIVETMREAFLIEAHRLDVGVSVGVALAPADGLDPDRLLKCADLALYRAKGEGRDTFRRFEAAMDIEAQARRAIELDIREALTRGEFELFYQPVLDIAQGHVVGFEALLRWRHPTRGIVAPAEFIMVAEDTGLIVGLGEWVLRQACSEALRFPAGTRIAVNVSAVQFRSSNFVELVVSALAASGLPPDRLELEITETVLMQSNEGVLKALHDLRSLGVRIALDDFGTGYSSLSYVRSFPFDKIKIDRSFVKELGKNPDCAAIVRAIVSLGAGLGIVTTAEGVETDAQLDFIRACGCSEAQGHLLGAPKPLQHALGLFEGARAVTAA